MRLLSFVLILFSLTGCSGKTDTGTCDSPATPSVGMPDTHCGDRVVTVDPAQCTATDTSSDADTDTGMGMGDYGATMYGTSGNDDDCKYAVTWSATDICENNDVTFTLGVTALADGAAVTGADPNIEAYLTATPTHLAPNSGQATTELGGGQYSIGPVHFDASGAWTVRFHLFEDCADAETSPHGHAAFSIDVP